MLEINTARRANQKKATGLTLWAFVECYSCRAGLPSWDHPREISWRFASWNFKSWVRLLALHLPSQSWLCIQWVSPSTELLSSSFFRIILVPIIIILINEPSFHPPTPLTENKHKNRATQWRFQPHPGRTASAKSRVHLAGLDLPLKPS